MNRIEWISIGITAFAAIIFVMVVYLNRQCNERCDLRCDKKITEENASRLEKIYEDTKKVYKRKTNFDNLDASLDLEWVRKQRLSS